MRAEDVPVPRIVRVLTAVAALGGLLFGYDTGVISGALLYLKDDFDLSPFEQEAVVGGATGGALVGALAGAWAVDAAGRRPSTMAAAAIFTVGAAVMAAAPGFGVLMVGRVVVGLGIGLASTAVPVYVAEVAPPAHRGRLTATFVLFVTGGQFVSYLVDTALAGVPGGWRWMLGLSGVPAAFQLFAMVPLPESPRHLIRAGRDAEARAVLLRTMAGQEAVSGSSRTLDEVVDAEVAEVRAEVDAELEGGGSMLDLLRSRELRPMLVVALGLQFFQQLCGINVALYYGPTVVRMAGFSSNRTAILLADAVAFANMTATFVASRLIDRKGRRRLLLWSLAGCAVSMALLGACFYLMTGFAVHRGSCGEYSSCGACALDSSCGFCGGSCVAGNATGPAVGAECPRGSEWLHEGGCGGFAAAGGFLSVLCLVLFVSSFAMGIGTVPWTVQSEIFGIEYRSKAAGLATATNWASNLVVSLTFLTFVRAASPPVAFWSFGAVAVVAAAFVHRLLPETKGLSLEDVASVFGGRRGLVGGPAAARNRAEDGQLSAVGGQARGSGAYQRVADEY